jgi:hypothetical protein
MRTEREGPVVISLADQAERVAEQAESVAARARMLADLLRAAAEPSKEDE